MEERITQAIENINQVIRASARNSEKLIEIKERIMKRNARGEYRYHQMKAENQWNV